MDLDFPDLISDPSSLEQVHEDLLQVEQTDDFSQQKSVQTLTIQLQSLLSDRGERNQKQVLLAANCLAEVLRIAAPDAPMSPRTLKEYFDRVIILLERYLVDDKDSDQSRKLLANQLLDSLTSSRAFSLLCQLNNETLITRCIDLCYAKAHISSNVKACFAEVLGLLVDENEDISISIIERILEPLKPPIKSSCVDIANECLRSHSAKLQGVIGHYFCSCLTEDQEEEEEEEEGKKRKKAKIFDKIESLHQIVFEISKQNETVLLGVFPQLEEELKVETDYIREVATKTVGYMFCGEFGQSLFSKYPSLWLSWLERCSDKCISIRILWCDIAMLVFKNHQEYNDLISEKLKTRLLDPDEKVRLHVCDILRNHSKPSQFSSELVKEWSLRCRDKKVSVRQSAMFGLAKALTLTFGELNLSHPTITVLRSISQSLLSLYNSGDIDVYLHVDWLIDDLLFPLKENTLDSFLGISLPIVSIQDRWNLIQESCSDDLIGQFLKRKKWMRNVVQEWLTGNSISKFIVFEQQKWEQILKKNEKWKSEHMDLIEQVLAKYRELDCDSVIKIMIKKASSYSVPFSLVEQWISSRNERMINLVADHDPSLLLGHNLHQKWCLYALTKILTLDPTAQIPQSIIEECKSDESEISFEIICRSHDEPTVASLVRKWLSDSHPNWKLLAIASSLCPNMVPFENLVSKLPPNNCSALKAVICHLCATPTTTRQDLIPFVKAIHGFIYSGDQNLVLDASKLYFYLIQTCVQFDGLLRFYDLSVGMRVEKREDYIRYILEMILKEYIPRYYSILLFLVATEENHELKDDVIQALHFAAIKWSNDKTQSLAGMISLLMYLLAQLFPPTNVHVAMDVIQFYIEIVLSRENLSFIYESVNQVKIHETHPVSQSIYPLCDMMHWSIKKMAHSKAWPIDTYPVPVALPRSFFRPLDNMTAEKVFKKNYLPSIFEKKKVEKKRREEKIVEKEEIKRSSRIRDKENISYNE